MYHLSVLTANVLSQPHLEFKIFVSNMTIPNKHKCAISSAPKICCEIHDGTDIPVQ